MEMFTMQIPRQIEPKRNNRWVVSIPTIDEWVFQSITFPSKKKGLFGFKWEDIHATLLDPIGSNMPGKIEGLIDQGEFLFSIKSLDPAGVEIEHWVAIGKITYVNYGHGDYKDDGLKMISITIKPSSVGLITS